MVGGSPPLKNSAPGDQTLWLPEDPHSQPQADRQTGTHIV